MPSEPNNSLTGRRAFVTGASGFIGRRLVQTLADAGAIVTTLSRSRRSKPGNTASHVNQIFGNIADTDLLRRELQNQDILFNLAYDIRAGGAENLAAFDGLMNAANSAGITRFVHLSSIVVYDGWPNRDLDETCSANGSGGGPYRQTKIEMERRLLKSNIPAAILQPTIVYGPGSALWTDRLAEALVSGGIVLPEPQGICNGVFVDDVVQAILRSAQWSGQAPDRFIISGDAPFAWSDLLDGYVEILGSGDIVNAPVSELNQRLGAAPSNAPDSAPALAARISSVARKFIGNDKFESAVRIAKRKMRKQAPMYPDHGLLTVFSATGRCSIDKARQKLGYEPKFDLAAGLNATSSHLQKTTIGKS